MGSNGSTINGQKSTFNRITESSEPPSILVTQLPSDISAPRSYQQICFDKYIWTALKLLYTEPIKILVFNLAQKNGRLPPGIEIPNLDTRSVKDVYAAIRATRKEHADDLNDVAKAIEKIRKHVQTQLLSENVVQFTPEMVDAGIPRLLDEYRYIMSGADSKILDPVDVTCGAVRKCENEQSCPVSSYSVYDVERCEDEEFEYFVNALEEQLVRTCKTFLKALDPGFDILTMSDAADGFLLVDRVSKVTEEGGGETMVLDVGILARFDLFGFSSLDSVC
ncbi:hypothetical protein GLAREA_11103 [Glarea lozoyensis ATCC 20868]|uniref:Uncharacterized protein n=1 Tax=Glarea lozoyensis (strain ATCC 20868 / MF5171) TaxID=1116229 RepID=S3DE78_GLAL2|nr:uncharacterized protein GLAREA_11103 [Glarea lozoyensis ATCC 20868]EPE35404.1 hypothetical protein GLAREA_11103 [Glarea lozoyensis ATCC 20868]